MQRGDPLPQVRADTREGLAGLRELADGLRRLEAKLDLLSLSPERERDSLRRLEAKLDLVSESLLAQAPPLGSPPSSRGPPEGAAAPAKLKAGFGSRDPPEGAATPAAKAAQ